MIKILLISLLLIPQISFAENLLLRDSYGSTIDIDTDKLSEKELKTFIALSKKLKIKSEKPMLAILALPNHLYMKGIRSNNCEDNIK
jgi:hypothetical protein